MTLIFSESDLRYHIGNQSPRSGSAPTTTLEMKNVASATCSNFTVNPQIN